MRFTLALASIAAFTASATAQQCAEASRFGLHTITPTTLSAGETFTITSNFTCSFHEGIRPTYVDYIVRNVVNNNGFEPNVVLLRRTNPPIVDTFTTQLPTYYWFPNASYSLQALLNYPVAGQDGSSVLIQGYIEDTPLQITPNYEV